MGAAPVAKTWKFVHHPARTLSLGFGAACFGIFCLLPISYMFLQTFLGRDGNPSLHNYRQLLLEPRQHLLLFNSLLLAAGSAVLAAVVGTPLGVLLARVDIPAKHIIRVALLIPLVVPPYILALAWIYTTGTGGLVALLLEGGLAPGWIYSIGGAVFVLGMSYFPIVMLTAEGAARGVDAHLEEAAILVSKPGGVFWRITAPLMAPGIAAASLLVFVLALSEFGAPSLLRVPVFTTEVFTAFAALYDFGRATALAIPLLLTTLLAGIAVRLLIGDRMITSSRTMRTGLPLHLGKWRLPAFAMMGLVILLSIALPLAALARESAGAWHAGGPLRELGGAITNSLVISASSATFIVAIGTLLGYGIARMRLKARGIAELIALVSFAAPGTVVAIGLIGLWNRPGLTGVVYKSMAVIVIACAARFLPLAALILAAGARQIAHSAEEAAEVAGAGWFRSFSLIIVPQLRGGIIAAWVVVFIFSLGELGAAILVAPPGESTLPVQIYTLLANTTSNKLASLALLQASLVMAPLILLAPIMNKEGDA